MASDQTTDKVLQGNTETASERISIGVLRELWPGETRVSVSPQIAKKYVDLGFVVRIEQGAGLKAGFLDEDYAAFGAEVCKSRDEVLERSKIILLVKAPALEDSAFFAKINRGTLLICFIWPLQNPVLLEKLAEKGVSGFAMDAIPRISRAQKFDALSSMANLGGYRAVLEASHVLGRILGGQITAAGRIPPTKVLVIGAGVAGLSAIGAARSLGAIVRAFDTRLEVKEQVQSMGADFLELHFKEDGSGSGGYAKVMSEEFIKAEMSLFAKEAKEVDIIVTTALIPGKPAPKLITKEMVQSMKPGSVIIDLASEQGGNCEATVPGQIAEFHRVKIIGYTDLPGRMPAQASELYAGNLFQLVTSLVSKQTLNLDLKDEVVGCALVTHGGAIRSAAERALKTQASVPNKHVPNKDAANKDVTSKNTSKNGSQAEKAAKLHGGSENKTSGGGGGGGWLLGLGLLLILVGLYAPAGFLTHITVFVLACLVGWQVIWNVTPALHTPLMSVTNAVSGIIVVGGVLQVIPPLASPSAVLGLMAVFFGTINIVGGFMVTQRMLAMFRRGE